jgi:hypothetical protein
MGPMKTDKKSDIKTFEDEPRWVERVETESKGIVSGKEDECKRKSTYYEVRLGREPC